MHNTTHARLNSNFSTQILLRGTDCKQFCFASHHRIIISQFYFIKQEGILSNLRWFKPFDYHIICLYITRHKVIFTYGIRYKNYMLDLNQKCMNANQPQTVQSSLFLTQRDTKFQNAFFKFQDARYFLIGIYSFMRKEMRPSIAFKLVTS